MDNEKKNSLFERIVNTYITAIYKKYILTLILFVAIIIFGIHYAAKLKLKSDFAELLPENYPSVVYMKKLIKRVGGLGSLFIAIESDNLEASMRFADDLVESMKKNLPPKTFKYIDYNMTDLKNFYEKNKYLYIDYVDLQRIHERLQKKIEWEKLKQNPLFINLEDEEEKEKEFSIDDIINKYKQKTSGMDKTVDGYYVSDDRKLLVILTRPYGTSTGVDFAKRLMEDIEKLAADLDPSKYDPSIKIGFGGNFKTTLDEYDSLREDILSTLILCVSLISIVIFLYLLRIRFIFLIGSTVLIGTVITFMVTYFNIGYLTSQTAFLGSIIIGNGINYGLIFFARYVEERRKRNDVLASLLTSTKTTMLPTFTAAFATSASFATLVLAQNRGFSQFGFIGGLGMLMCWLCSFTFLPAILTLTEKIIPVIRKKSAREHRALLFKPFSLLVKAATRGIIIFGIIIVSISIVLIYYFIPNALEMDFSKLRNKESMTSGTAILNRRIGKIFELTMNPSAILANKESQVKQICEEIYRKEKVLLTQMRYSRIIDKCVSIYSFLPENQEKKLKELKKIKKLLSGKTLNFLNEEQKAELEKFRTQFDLKPLTKHDLPVKIKKLFEEQDGRIGLITYVYSSKKYGSIWDGRNLMKYADLVRELTLKDGTKIYSSGSSVVFADMLRAIAKDGPVTSLAALIAVILIVFINFRNLRAGVLIITNLLAGVLLMGGILALFDIKLNYFNFIAVPVTFGIGVDYAVNMYQRYKLEGRGSAVDIIRTTGGAVALCSSTTIIGYSVLMIANNQALYSFGLVAIIGEFTTLFAALLFLPATIILLEKRDKKKYNLKENGDDKNKKEPPCGTIAENTLR